MTRIKHRVSYGAMAGGVLFATVLAPAQAVLAATGSDTTSPATTSTTTTTVSPQTITPAPTATSTANNPQSPHANSTLAGGSTQTNNNLPVTAAAQQQSGSSTTNAPSGSTSSAADTKPASNSNSQKPQDSSGSPSTDQPATNAQNNTNQAATTTTDSTAASGNVKVQGNLSSVGNTSSGKASTVSNQVTSLNSASSLNSAGSLQTFTFDINGNHVGDIVLSPGDFLQSSAATKVQTVESSNVTNQTDSTISNTIDLSSLSGDVTVQGNLGNVGDVASGDASTQLNLINMIESTVTDKQAFVGMVNINGNLKGNLLLPKSAIDELLPPPVKAAVTTNTANATSTTTNNLTVNNNVTLDASSGDVKVEGNGGSTGNVSSGSGISNLKLYNLTNSKIVGGNVLLVFVNVEGSWAGLLMNAPAGTTSAALGGRITQDTAIQNTATTTTNETITNNIKLSSKSGNVKVQGNGGNTGNVKSGSASANADVVNIMGSQIDLSGWLGVMVINVYGGWQGSLEIQPVGTTIHVKAPPVHRILSHANPYQYGLNSTSNNGSLHNTKLVSDNVLGENVSKPTPTALSKSGKDVSDHKSGLLSAGTIAAVGAILAITGGATQFLTHRRK
jgi:hypothetical protein